MTANEFWDEARKLRSELMAAGEEMWSIALRDALAGCTPRTQMPAEVTLCLERLRQSGTCLRLGLADRIDGLLHAGSDAAGARR